MISIAYVFTLPAGSCCRGLLGAVAIIVMAAGHAGGESNTDDHALLRKGPVVVSQADFEAELQAIPEEHRQAFLTSFERIQNRLLKLFTQKSVAHEARERGLDQDPGVRQRMSLAAEFVLADAYLDSLVAQESNVDLEPLARERYQTDLDKFKTPEQVRVSHILIKTENRSELEAQAQAEQVLAMARADDVPFAELALEFSQDPSVEKNRGDLGFFERGAMVKPFAEAAFAMDTSGELVLVKSPFGYHVIRFEERRPQRQQSFEEIKAGLMNELRRELKTRIRDTHLKRLSSLEGAEINQKAIEALTVQTDFSQGSKPSAQ